MNRNSDYRQSDPLFSPELIEEYVKHARQLRSEAMARGIRRLFAKMRGGSRRMGGVSRAGAAKANAAHCGACA